MTVNLNTIDKPNDLNEAIARTTAWLLANQNEEASWGKGPTENKLISTSAILNGLLHSLYDSKDLEICIRRALGYLQSQRPYSNESLCRVIDTLQRYQLEPYRLHTKLALDAYTVDDNPQDSQPAKILGWGRSPDLYPDAFSTAWGIIAQENARSYVSPISSEAKAFLNGETITVGSLSIDGSVLYSEDTNRYAWVSGHEESAYVSALAYKALGKFHYSNDLDYAWLIVDFGDSIENQASKLAHAIFTNNGTPPRIQFLNSLLDLQHPSGSWSEDPYLTGLGLEALATPKVLYVYSGSINDHDTDIQALIEKRGYRIIAHDDNNPFPEDLSKYSMVYLSGTVDPVIVRDHFKDAEIPVVVNHYQLYDDMGLAGDEPGDTGSATGQPSLLIHSSHSLAADLPPGMTYSVSSSGDYGWAKLEGNPIKIATIDGDPEKITIFGYEAGQILEDGSAAKGKRIGFFLRNDSDSLTDYGKDLLDAAIVWSIRDRSLNR